MHFAFTDQNGLSCVYVFCFFLLKSGTAQTLCHVVVETSVLPKLLCAFWWIHYAKITPVI